ncbi:hypothetical protein BJ165DRAFT_1401027 [Panaeolus papilionaceus]|nr:hypothetical protein BJ165DRAFT_1401027 [Panaeolus papilionaceus]
MSVQWLFDFVLVKRMDYSRDEVPVFPNEIFGLIINNIANNSYQSLSKVEISALCACSSTSSVFHSFTRPHIFRRIDIGFWAKSGERLPCLLEVFEAESTIRRYVRELHIDLLESSGKQLTYPQLELCAQSLVQLPFLETLSIRDGYHYAASGRAMFRGPLTSKVLDVCNIIIMTYLTQPSVKSLRIEDNNRLSDLPYSAIFTCTTLTNLQLVDFYLKPEAQAEIQTKLQPQVKSLTMTGDQSSNRQKLVLSRFTGLKELTLDGGFPEGVPQPLPVFKLESLTIGSDGTKGDLSNAFKSLWHTDDLGHKVISGLKRLPSQDESHGFVRVLIR